MRGKKQRNGRRSNIWLNNLILTLTTRSHTPTRIPSTIISILIPRARPYRTHMSSTLMNIATTSLLIRTSTIMTTLLTVTDIERNISPRACARVRGASVNARGRFQSRGDGGGVE